MFMYRNHREHSSALLLSLRVVHIRLVHMHACQFGESRSAPHVSCSGVQSSAIPFIMSWGCPVVPCARRASRLTHDFVTCRLQARGLKVLVERGVRQKEFPQFEEFTPNSPGKHQHALYLLDRVLTPLYL